MSEVKFPFEIKNFKNEKDSHYFAKFDEQNNVIRVGPKNYLLLANYKEEASYIYNLKMRPTDVIVASLPRSGTSWTQELVWLVANDLNYEEALRLPLFRRYLFLGKTILSHFLEKSNGSNIPLDDAGDPRFLRTHLPFSLLPPSLIDTSKVVYVARNPKDVAVSMFHYCRLVKFIDEDHDFKPFWNYFYHDIVLWGPYFEHVKEAWELRNHPNMLFLFYEDLCMDLKSSVRIVSKFLGKEFTEEELNGLCEHLAFDNIKTNKSVNISLSEEFEKLISKKESFVRRGPMKDFIRVGPKGYFLPKAFENHINDTYNMALRKNDIFVTSYQRSGTTLTQELVWLLANNLDYDTATTVLLMERYPFIDLPMFINAEAKEMLNKSIGDNAESREMLKHMLTSPMEMLASTSDRRFVKSHLPFSMLPPTLLDTAKVVYVARDPRDVAVSSYHHTKLFTIMGYTGDFKQFWNLFIKDKFILTPYFEHVKEAWALRNHPNMLFLFYEDLTKDLPSSVHKVAKFLGKEYTQEQISELCDHLSIEKFKNNKSVNFEELRDFGMLNSGEKFVRKGKTGGWRDSFDAEMTQQAEQWITVNLESTDLRFPSMGDIN